MRSQSSFNEAHNHGHKTLCCPWVWFIYIFKYGLVLMSIKLVVYYQCVHNNLGQNISTNSMIQTEIIFHGWFFPGRCWLPTKMGYVIYYSWSKILWFDYTGLIISRTFDSIILVSTACLVACNVLDVYIYIYIYIFSDMHTFGSLNHIKLIYCIKLYLNREKRNSSIHRVLISRRMSQFGTQWAIFCESFTV